MTRLIDFTRRAALVSCGLTLACSSPTTQAGDLGAPHIDAGAGTACADGLRDGDESDIDCGGSCGPCSVDQRCAHDSDCKSFTCGSGRCLATSCNDGVRNSKETDVDCGGLCPGCYDGQLCKLGSDCSSGKCTAGVCIGPISFQAPVVYPVPLAVRAFDLAMGDFDGDGKADVASYLAANPGVSLFRGVGGGKLGSPPVSIMVYNIGPMTSGDVNGDGRSDLIVGGPAALEVLLGGMGGALPVARGYTNAFASEQFSAPSLIDWNGDGHVDVATFSKAGHLTLFYNNGDGTFGLGPDYARGTEGTSVVTGDFDGDGNKDLALASTPSIEVLLGDGKGGYSKIVTQVSRAVTLVVGDFNRDGKDDIAMPKGSGSAFSLLLGAAGGKMQSLSVDGFHVANAVTYLVAADWDGDGILDLAFENSDTSDLRIVQGRGDGTFRGSIAVQMPESSLIVGDLNGDGKPDLVMGVGSDIVVLLNDSH